MVWTMDMDTNFTYNNGPSEGFVSPGYHISDSAVKAADMHKPIGLWGCHKQESVTQCFAIKGSLSRAGV
jgi:hypothetical protein